jgi:oligoribonuclease NrnB/cAMP/cGMP phosphodiesterase (DHH superfamily)
MQPLVIYHAQCRDGFGAAWCVWRRSANAEFFAASYGKPPPDVTGRMVYMVDFCYPRPVLEEMADKCATMLILDHHKTAEAAIGPASGFSRPNVEVHFDMERSGAGMTWDRFFPGQPRPWLIDYIEDRDLWKHKLPNGPAVNAFIGTIRFDFEAYYKASRLDVDEVARLGVAVEDKIRQYVTEVSGNALRIDFEGSNVPIVNAPQVDISELVGFLAQGEPFAMGWWQRSDGLFSYSLRSKGDVDVSAIAKKHGGGGHRSAAGFTSPTPFHLVPR